MAPEEISLQSAKSGAGEQFLPVDCMAKARVKGMFFSQHRYHIMTGMFVVTACGKAVS